MVDMQATDGALDRATSLARSTRERILAIVRGSDHPATVAEVAAAARVHRTAARLHLRHLAEAGLAHEITLPPTGRGRPRLGYVPIDDQPYRAMASWLVTAVSAEDGVSIGRSVGADAARSGGDAVARIVDEAARRGFDPVVEDAAGDQVEVVLRACPFAAIARQSPSVVCGLHRGIMEGIAATSGGVTVTRLDVGDPAHGECRLVLQRSSS